MQIFAQFLLRLAFGLAVGMAITSPRHVASGYFRNHLYVTLGLATLAALVVFQQSSTAAFFAAVAAGLSFVGAACWLYDAARAGRTVLWLIAAAAFTAALATDSTTTAAAGHQLRGAIAIGVSGLVLGLTLAAMLLGHWYLNAPGMELAPLRRLLAAAAIAIGLQAIFSGIGVTNIASADTPLSTYWLLFIAFRWLFGIGGVLVLLWLAWRTLAIPNTQSATGILYVAVMGVFVGELAAALLSAQCAFPL